MYLIFNKETTYLVKNLPHQKPAFPYKRFQTEGSAKAFLTRMVHAGLNRDDYAIADSETFHNQIEKQETKNNLLSGKPFVQAVNTPLCCDPSSETYWSM